MRWQAERSSSESYFWPVIWAVGFHVLMFAMLFVSFAMTPDLPPARPVVQATLYKLQSQSKATVQTNQKIAGEAVKTKAPTNQVEQLEQKKSEQDKLEVAKAEAKAEAVKEAAAAKQEAAEAKKVADAAKAVEVKQLADLAKKKSEEEKKKAEAEAQKKKAADDAKKKAADEEKKKTAEADKKKAADAAKKKTAAEAAKRKAVEDKKAQALAELLSETTDYQQTVADTQGDETAGSLDDAINRAVSNNWTRPPSARNGMSVQVQIEMLPDGTITNASVARSSGDAAFDGSAVSAVRRVGRIPEMQTLSPSEFNPYRSFKTTFTPEDLAL